MEGKIVLRGWLILRGIFIRTISAFYFERERIFLRGSLIDRGIFVITNKRVSTSCKSELVLHRWLIERRILMTCLYFDLALFTNRTIGMISFTIGTNSKIGANGPPELPCTQPGHRRKLLLPLRTYFVPAM